MTVDDQDLKVLAAHHEAGHALLAWLTGCELGEVSITGANGGGNCRIGPPDKTPGAERRRDAVMRHMAGAAAEARVLALNVSFAEAEERAGGARTDCATARKRGGEPFDYETAWRSTLDLLERHRYAVKALANRLLAAGRVDGAEARRILEAEAGWERYPPPGSWETVAGWPGGLR
jgi:hypothetical protein